MCILLMSDFLVQFLTTSSDVIAPKTVATSSDEASFTETVVMHASSTETVAPETVVS